MDIEIRIGNSSVCYDDEYYMESKSTADISVRTDSGASVSFRVKAKVFGPNHMELDSDSEIEDLEFSGIEKNDADYIAAEVAEAFEEVLMDGLEAEEAKSRIASAIKEAIEYIEEDLRENG